MIRCIPTLLPLLLLLAVLGLARPDSATAQSSFSPPDKAFTMSLPSGFVAIPALELYLFEHPGQSGPVTPEAMAEFKATRMGFQRPADNWFTPPYMIITREVGKKRGPQELFMDHVMAQKDSEAHSSGEGYRFLEKEHQPTKRMHYYKDTGYSPGLGKNMAMGVYTYLTSQGFLRVAWFVPEDQLKSWEQVLHQSAMSVKLAPEMEYKPEGKP